MQVAMTRAVHDSDSAEGLKRARTWHDEAAMLRERLDSQAAIAREEVPNPKFRLLQDFLEASLPG